MKARGEANEKLAADLRIRAAQGEADASRALTGNESRYAAYEAQIAELMARVKQAETSAKQIAELQTQIAKSQAEAAPAAKKIVGDIERIEGIGPAYGQKLRGAGIAWVLDLLDRGADAAGRAQIASATGIKPDFILTWVNAADLLRVDGVTPDWAELLEAPGVDTVKELRNRAPANLLQAMTETNPAGPGGRFAASLPKLEEVESWAGQAKAMRPRVTHNARGTSA